ncbi:MAG: flavodoxin family protein [Candidatus Altiarchaeota archaeon]|nr:flavodoxin family protein [Candidatus Altiarchaeota archaeon]
MKTLIIYHSEHHMNTEKVAKAMAKVLDAKLVRVGDAKAEMLKDYDLIGFGSGVYGFKPHQDIVGFVESLPKMKKKAFVFTTSGSGKEKYTDKLRWQLSEKGFDLLGCFTCKGFCTWGPFKLFGGGAKGHPDEGDLEKAREFAEGLKA